MEEPENKTSVVHDQKKQSVNLLLLPSSAKIKMQMYNGVLLCICPRCVIKLNLEGIP